MPQVPNIRSRRASASAAGHPAGRGLHWPQECPLWAEQMEFRTAIHTQAGHAPAVASYERWLRSQPHLMDALHELRGLDLVCWCAPLPCHEVPEAGQRNA